MGPGLCDSPFCALFPFLFFPLPLFREGVRVELSSLLIFSRFSALNKDYPDIGIQRYWGAVFLIEMLGKKG